MAYLTIKVDDLDINRMTRKRTYKEVKRRLKPLNIDYREYDFDEMITCVTWAKKSEFDDYIHFLYQSIRTVMSLRGEDADFLLIKKTKPTTGLEYQKLTSEYFARCIEKRNNLAKGGHTFGERIFALPDLLDEARLIDGYILEPLDEIMGDFDLIMILDDYYVRFYCSNLM